MLYKITDCLLSQKITVGSLGVMIIANALEWIDQMLAQRDATY